MTINMLFIKLKLRLIISIVSDSIPVFTHSHYNGSQGDGGCFLYELENNLMMWEIGACCEGNGCDSGVTQVLPNFSEMMDALLVQCFLHALKSKVKKSELPLLTSTFLRNHMFSCW